MLAAIPATSEQTPLVVDQLEVRLVTVEVLVTDSQGNPVRDLARDDFELLRDGEPVEIITFGKPGEHLQTPSDALSRENHRLNLALYVDLNFLAPGELGHALPYLEAFLTEELAPDDRILLLVATKELGLRQTPTTFRELVTTKLGLLAREPSHSRLSSEYREIIQEMERALGSGTFRQAPMIPATVPQMLLSRIEAFVLETQREIWQASSTLKQAVEAVGGLPGRNELLYIGSPPPEHASTALVNTWDRTFGRNSNYEEFAAKMLRGSQRGAGAPTDESSLGLSGFDSPVSGDASLGMADYFGSTGKYAASKDVRLHTVDVGRARSNTTLLSSPSGGDLTAGGGGSGLNVSPDVNQGIQDKRSLRRLAEVTGGRHFAVGSSLGSQLARLGQDRDSVYSLGFTPAPPEDRDLHEIDVRLPKRSKGLSLSHRRYYRPRDWDEEAVQRTISALLLDAPEDPLEMELRIGQEKRLKKGQVSLPVSITLPLAKLALVARGRIHTGQISVFATSIDSERQVAPVRRSVVPVHIANHELLTSLGRKVEYSLKLTVPQKTDRVAVGVRDDLALLTSTAVTAVQFPKPSQKQRSKRDPADRP